MLENARGVTALSLHLQGDDGAQGWVPARPWALMRWGWWQNPWSQLGWGGGSFPQSPHSSSMSAACTNSFLMPYQRPSAVMQGKARVCGAALQPSPCPSTQEPPALSAGIFPHAADPTGELEVLGQAVPAIITPHTLTQPCLGLLETGRARSGQPSATLCKPLAPNAVRARSPTRAPVCPVTSCPSPGTASCQAQPRQGDCQEPPNSSISCFRGGSPQSWTAGRSWVHPCLHVSSTSPRLGCSKAKQL